MKCKKFKKHQKISIFQQRGAGYNLEPKNTKIHKTMALKTLNIKQQR